MLVSDRFKIEKISPGETHPWRILAMGNTLPEPLNRCYLSQQVAFARLINFLVTEIESHKRSLEKNRVEIETLVSINNKNSVLLEEEKEKIRLASLALQGAELVEPDEEDEEDEENESVVSSLPSNSLAVGL